MSFKELNKKIIGDVKWKDLDHKKVYMALAAVIVVIVLIVLLVSGAFSKKSETPQSEEAVIASEEIVEEVTEGNPLEVDTYDEINELIEKYFDNLAAGDVERVDETVDELTEEEVKTIEKKKDYIEAYDNVVCYTKKGLEEDSFVVFASYEMKIHNIETPAPGIMAFYVISDVDGGYKIYNQDASEELTSYVLELAAEEEIAAIIADVDARYQQLVAEDEELGKFAQTMLESKQQAEEEEDAEVEEPTDGDVKELEEPIETTVNDGIRLREGRSTDTRTLGGIAKDTKVKVYASYSDGWSKIEYNGVIGHCMTEFLTSTEGVPMLSVDSDEPEAETEEAEEAEETTTETSESTAVNKQMQFKETVRIRKERSTESERISTGYINDNVKVVENYSDGWSKIEYKGMTGYCKTEFLGEAR